MARAVKLCPQGVFLPVRMTRYQEVSRQVFAVFQRYTSRVEIVSVDEAFLDVSGSRTLFGSPESIARQIKQAVQSELGLTVSAGVAPNKFLSKIASDLDKPDGLTVVPPDGIESFLHPLPVGKLWGVGEATQKGLSSMAIRTIGDLSRMPLTSLERRFGKNGRHLHMLSRGIDEREVETGRECKSIGHEDTYAQDLVRIEDLHRELLSLATRVARRLRAHGLEGRTITVKVKYSNFDQVTRSFTLENPTDDGSQLFETAQGLLKKTDAGRRPVRLLGIQVSKLDSTGSLRQVGLFDDDDKPRKRRDLNRALDRIQERFGEEAVVPGLLVDEEEKQRSGRHEPEQEKK